MKNHYLRIATRKSILAIRQAQQIEHKLKKLYPTLTVELLPLTTTGDQVSAASKIDNKSLFVKELEQALIDQRADIAVHSVKDVPTLLPDMLIMPVVCEREDPRDVWVASHRLKASDARIIGSSSLRRQCQLKALYPDLIFKPLRGNVDTRIHQLDAGICDALILAAAGLIRLQYTNRITNYLTPEQCLPAAGQGALGIECRKDDQRTLELLAPLNHLPSQLCIQAERAMTQRLGSGCHLPVAAYATLNHQEITLRGLIGTPDGSLLLRSTKTTSIQHGEKIGVEVAEDLLAQGGGRILTDLFGLARF